MSLPRRIIGTWEEQTPRAVTFGELRMAFDADLARAADGGRCLVFIAGRSNAVSAGVDVDALWCTLPQLIDATIALVQSAQIAKALTDERASKILDLLDAQKLETQKPGGGP